MPSKWYVVSCEKCGADIPAHEDWNKPPRFCQSCKAENDAKWYEKACEKCGATMKVCRDWDRPPQFCKSCKQANPPKDVSCSHCGTSFTISAGTQIQCRKNGWDLPKRCRDCRELFKYKPFKTIREDGLLSGIVYRTYNSMGQLIGESRDEKGLFGDKRRTHQSRTGRPTGVTREGVSLLPGDHYKETTGPDGQTKSISREREDWLGDKYTESVGGASKTEHQTRTRTDLAGEKYRETK